MQTAKTVMKNRNQVGDRTCPRGIKMLSQDHSIKIMAYQLGIDRSLEQNKESRNKPRRYWEQGIRQRRHESVEESAHNSVKGIGPKPGKTLP